MYFLNGFFPQKNVQIIEICQIWTVMHWLNQSSGSQPLLVQVQVFKFVLWSIFPVLYLFELFFLLNNYFRLIFFNISYFINVLSLGDLVSDSKEELVKWLIQNLKKCYFKCFFYFRCTIIDFRVTQIPVKCSVKVTWLRTTERGCKCTFRSVALKVCPGLAPAGQPSL